MRIHLLNDQTANQIAVGEVIESGASVVKELIENSIDAGATHIRIDISQGGCKQIRIRDDGSGIHCDDLALAFERHATSKIKKAEDLQCVATIGFGGEALASILAVARLKLISRHPKAEMGYSINNAAGKLTAPMPTAYPQGTTKNKTCILKRLILLHYVQIVLSVFLAIHLCSQHFLLNFRRRDWH